MPVDLQLSEALGEAPPLEAQDLERWLGALTSVVADGRLSREICVRLCDRDESRALNEGYRGKDKPTNVLSFAVDVDVPDAPLGDLAICWPIVTVEATDQGKSTLDHLAHLFCHGVLHLLGYDHEDQAHAAVMEDLEIRALAALGVANPYEA